MTDPMAPAPTRSGHDTWDLIETALRQLAGRRVVQNPASLMPVVLRPASYPAKSCV